jgi:hypothetical protein
MFSNHVLPLRTSVISPISGSSDDSPDVLTLKEIIQFQLGNDALVVDKGDSTERLVSEIKDPVVTSFSSNRTNLRILLRFMWEFRRNKVFNNPWIRYFEAKWIAFLDDILDLKGKNSVLSSSSSAFLKPKLLIDKDLVLNNFLIYRKFVNSLKNCLNGRESSHFSLLILIISMSCLLCLIKYSSILFGKAFSSDITGDGPVGQRSNSSSARAANRLRVNRTESARVQAQRLANAATDVIILPEIQLAADLNTADSLYDNSARRQLPVNDRVNSACLTSEDLIFLG